MKIFPTVVRRITNVLAGALNFAGRPEAAARVDRTVMTLVSEPRVAAGRVARVVGDLLVRETAGPSSSASVSGAVAPADQRPGPTSGTRNTGRMVPEHGEGTQGAARPVVGDSRMRQRPPGRIRQVTYDLVHTSHVQPGTARQDAGGSWTDVDEAEGVADGVAAHLSGGIVLVTGTLRGDFPAQPNRTSLTITQVILRFRVSISGLTLLENMILGYRVGDLGLARTLETMTANTGGFVTREHDITAALDGPGGEGLTWATVEDLQPFITANAVVDSLVDHAVDAVELEVRANATDVF